MRASHVIEPAEQGQTLAAVVRALVPGASWNKARELVTRRLDAGPGVLLSQTTYASRFAVTFLVSRDGHEAVATYAPRTPDRDHDHERESEHGDDCMGEVF